jgi:ketosteroid isomerase-like protein
MPGETTVAVVRSYHDGWTSGDFAQATALLAEDLEVEVPINDYPTRSSFADALTQFGSMTQKVELLSEMYDGDEAMLLYDMDVDGLGRMRVAEHFAVADQKITRIRQIHDTATLRAAGFAS